MGADDPPASGIGQLAFRENDPALLLDHAADDFVALARLGRRDEANGQLALDALDEFGPGGLFPDLDLVQRDADRG